ncbi:CCA tRNA nucleotidyltransferase [Phaeobacter sp. J2-8]|uniref:CCA tRNA nucleotidyltransferase n=1 Tax=Phaeobacter sp. J2-8 TaxID=2931394 RepID=UPI001FD2EC03|nr:CCA tRNA nucleotidyltransferase [Phaeobacter sp. J2-8]MCJ7870968.1 CCA tRNA nucleotidyltransferase [Phaeobacter sp. J2-8]
MKLVNKIKGKVDLPERVSGDWLRNSVTQSVCAMLTDAGHAAHFVGGCVRNALIDAPVSDIDISTDARPERVMELARTAGFHVVPTGIDHGTVTVVADHIPHEITTWRKDVETDGRRAVVAFADSIDEDARRRDFTMNALYADAEGVITDPVGGLADLAERNIRFIDDADARIREDYLRSLRFFRFNAWYGAAKGGFDADALAAIASNLDGLDSLSRERVGSELIKLLAAPDPTRAVAAMKQSGVLLRLLPGADDTAIGPLVYVEEETGIAPDPILRLAALGGIDVSDRLRLSKPQAKDLAFFHQSVGAMTPPGEIGYRFGAELAEKLLVLRAAMMQEHIDARALARVAEGAAAQFPITAADLMPEFQGPALGDRLRQLEARWIASGFSLGREDLLPDD